MPNLLNETKFEEHIAGCLAQGDLYNQRTSADFSIEELCDRGMLERFLRAQSQTWHNLSLAYPGKEVDAVVTEYNKKLKEILTDEQYKAYEEQHQRRGGRGGFGGPRGPRGPRPEGQQ